MKVFIAGAKSINYLDEAVMKKLSSIAAHDFEVLVGDCKGIDTSVQEFFAKQRYQKVSIYASNGRARNNVGHWPVQNIPVPSYIRGFDFYAQKDDAMAQDADYGLMIWDGKSKGTRRNIRNLLMQKKKVLLFFTPIQKFIQVNSLTGLHQLEAKFINDADALSQNK